ncbi:sulfite exporter TauE/SafE family protein [Thermodesulfobacterium commune]|uniref:Probable membrane transporter protein n=1 Tax=Thermodesulfobacterium commune DSM 2178 TaxID=289377 RepID=A0A075WUM6_9BACT|nr:sulfite exporter TauE/SafE family protein [Thermodesulfobacterium commune]AIH04655.1 membrane protein [Thermodesulfobacterium commune DSM 2178]
MSKLRLLYEFMVSASLAHARWEKEMADNIFRNKKRLLLLLVLLSPILVTSLLGAADILGGKSAYAPVHYTPIVFWASTVVGFAAGLITGCIGAGGGFIIAPALMSVGVKGIMAVGTDQFHIFAKAIMGTVLHKKLGNVSVALAIFFIIGSIVGATTGGYINRLLYSKDPVLSDAFISTVYAVILGFLGFYAMYDYFSTRRKVKMGQASSSEGAHGGVIGTTNLAIRIQKINVPPIIKFDEDFGGRQISAWFIIAGGFVVGFLAAIMGVGGGFITFPMFVYVFGVSTPTTVGTDIFQIIFTAGYSSLTQYAIYGYVFYTLAMGLLIGSLIGIQIGALTTKVVPGITIRAFYALTILAGFFNRVSVLPDKFRSLNLVSISKEVCETFIFIGNILFWGAVGLFGVWVLLSFFKNIRTLREEG